MPLDPHVLRLLADAEAAAVRGDLGEAADTAGRAVIAAPDAIETWETLVTFRVTANDLRIAIAEVHDGLRRHPGSGRLWLLLATALAGTGRPRGAFAAAEIALRIQHDPGLAFGRDQVRARIGAADSAELERRYATLDPTAQDPVALVEEILELDVRA